MKKELSKEERLSVLESELEYLKKQRDNLKSSIEKKIYSERREGNFAKLLNIRLFSFTFILTLLVIAIVYYSTGSFTSNPPFFIISTALLIGFIFNKFYNKYRGKFLNDEANRLTKIETKDPKIVKKYTTQDEAQRAMILDKEIEERKESIHILKKQNAEFVEESDGYSLRVVK